MRKPTTITPARAAYNAARAEIYVSVYQAVKDGATWLEATRAAGVGVNCVIKWYKAKGLPPPARRRGRLAGRAPGKRLTEEDGRALHEKCMETCELFVSGLTWDEARERLGVLRSVAAAYARGLPRPPRVQQSQMVPRIFYTDDMCRRAYELSIEHDTDDTEKFGVPQYSLSDWRVQQGLPTRLELKTGRSRRNLRERFDVAFKGFSEGVGQIKACADAGISVGAFRRIRAEIGFVPDLQALELLRKKRNEKLGGDARPSAA